MDRWTLKRIRFILKETLVYLSMSIYRPSLPLSYITCLFELRPSNVNTDTHDIIGVRGLFDGISGTWMRQMSYSMCRFWAYDESKKLLGAGMFSFPLNLLHHCPFLGGYSVDGFTEIERRELTCFSQARIHRCGNCYVLVVWVRNFLVMSCLQKY